MPTACSDKRLTRSERQLYVRPVVLDFIRNRGPLLEADDKVTLCDLIVTALRTQTNLDFNVERQDVDRAIRYLASDKCKCIRAGYIYRIPDGEKVYRLSLLKR